MPKQVQDIWPYATNLAAIRGPLNVSQAAKRVDVDRQTWTAWENGTQRPKYETLKRIVEVFDCPPGLVGYEPPKGWELVPSAWIEQRFEQQQAQLDNIHQLLKRIARKAGA